MREALIEEDIDRVALLVQEEWENRKNLATGVTTERIEHLIKTAHSHGALASKICGAGGGGCMITLTQPDKRDDIITALKHEGAEIMDFSIDREGLKILERN